MLRRDSEPKVPTQWAKKFPRNLWEQILIVHTTPLLGWVAKGRRSTDNNVEHVYTLSQVRTARISSPNDIKLYIPASCKYRMPIPIAAAQFMLITCVCVRSWSSKHPHHDINRSADRDGHSDPKCP